jgi:opacity protein-like surface antigen
MRIIDQKRFVTMFSVGLMARLVMLVLLTVSVAFPQNLTKTGTSAAPFLKIGVGSRAMGMGGAFTATADDITAMYWNPGGLARLYSSEAMFNHVRWFADVNYDFAAFATHLSGFGTLGVFVDVLSMDAMLVRTVELPEGTGELFNAGAMAIGISYGRDLTDQFSIGFNVKYVREDIWNMSATGVAMDIGTIYRIPILNEFRIGASISNFGSRMRLQGRDNLMITQIGGTEGNLINTDIQLDEFDLPLLFRVGVAADILKSEESRLTVALDAVHPNDNTEYLNTGAEFAWNEIVFLRAGWKSLFERDTEQRFTAGIGLHYRILGEFMVKVDYAYQDWGRLTNVHYLTLGVRF